MNVGRSRGFTLIEVMVAGVLASLVALAGFAALSGVQTAAARQRRAVDLISQGRVAMELIGRDLRTAGDSVDRFPSPCLGALGWPNSPYRCAAILEPHPWRVVFTRNVWELGANGIPYTSDDIPPNTALTENPQNVVAYQFVPNGAGKVNIGPNGRQGVIGRLERVVNPYKFGGTAPQVTVLLDKVVLDNRMRVSPADPNVNDPRYDYALFMYQVMSVTTGEYAGNAAFTTRNTREGSFLLPPARFYDPFGTYAPFTIGSAAVAAPYLPTNYTAQVVGLAADATPATRLRTAAGTFGEDMRYMLDMNRIRTVRVAFHVVASTEDPGLTTGIDLDPDKPGTAASYPFEATFELKVFSSDMGALTL